MAPNVLIPSRWRVSSFMSKGTSTRWYIGAWIVGVISFVVFMMTAQKTATGTAFNAIGSTPVSGAAWLLVGICSLVMLVVWIGALIGLGQRRHWGWFAGVLILHLIGLGIVGMVAYAAAGPEDTAVAMRPTST